MNYSDAFHSLFVFSAVSFSTISVLLALSNQIANFIYECDLHCHSTMHTFDDKRRDKYMRLMQLFPPFDVIICMNETSLEQKLACIRILRLTNGMKCPHFTSQFYLLLMKFINESKWNKE